MLFSAVCIRSMHVGSSDFQLPVWRVKQLLRHEAESSRPVARVHGLLHACDARAHTPSAPVQTPQSCCCDLLAV